MTAPSGSSAPVPPDSFVPPSAEELAAMLPAYDISHLIAAGGMGAVYAGMQRALDRPVAIKILPPEAARDHESIDRFRTEAKAMARLTHPNIPAVYDFDVSAGYCYLVMEFIDGWNVHQLITQKELNPDLTYSLLTQVCDALAFAHQRGVVHGDIKPSNLLVTQDGVVKLADFGLAQLTGSREAEIYAPMGTPEYAAPELWQPGVIMDQRADLYSLGCVFYEMLTGSPPQGQFQLPSVPLKLDSRVDTVIARCMQQNPAMRYQKATEVRAALEAIRTAAPGSGSSPPKPTGTRVVRPPARRNAPPARGAAPARSAPPARRRSTSKPPADSGSPMLWIVLGLAALGVVIYFIINHNKPPVVPTPAPAAATAEEEAPRLSAAPNSPKPAPKPAPAASNPGTPTPAASPTAPAAEPPPTPTGPSQETLDKLAAFRTKFRSQWQAEVASKLQTETDRIAAFYTAALDKLREEFSGIGDAAALLALRDETDRFAKSRTGVAADQLSSIEKLAAIQKTLSSALDAANARIKPAATQLREQALLELKQLEDAAPEADQKAVATLYDKIVAASDLAKVLVD